MDIRFGMNGGMFAATCKFMKAFSHPDILRWILNSLNIRPTERPGLFTFVTGGRLLPNPEEIVQSEDALKAYIMERLCGREDVKIGKIRWMGPYTYVAASYEEERVMLMATIQNQCPDGR